MKKVILASLLILASSSAFSKSEFCNGFEVGYKTEYGNNNVYVPYCPYEPYTPYGSTPFQEGLKKGVEAARRKGR
jgi:hypothetical protein